MLKPRESNTPCPRTCLEILRPFLGVAADEDKLAKARLFAASRKLRDSRDSIGGAGVPSHPLMIFVRLTLGLLSSSALVLAQSCQNYGLLQGSTCLCPPGFGGSDCSSLACGGTIFQGSSRPTTPSPGNLTSAGCTCQDGWAGVGCNVCTSYSACQSGYVSQNPTSGNGVTGSDLGQNSTLVCNSAPRVWAAGQMSCSVTVESLYLRPIHRMNLICICRIQRYKQFTLALLL